MIFYPDIERREAYSQKEDGMYYASYSHYRDEITEDCKRRCVYCDVTLIEHGGEGMQLDHFKPQEHFNNLKNDPNNLVLACPKCNRLKSDYWPINEEIGLDGFLDPFTNDRNEWYKIHPCGSIEYVDSCAVELMIEKLNLNRPARVQVRRKRLLEQRIAVIDDGLNKKLGDLKSKIAAGENGIELVEEVIYIKEKMDMLRKL